MSLKFPSGEIVWVRYCNSGDPQFIITSKPSRDYYYLYQVVEDGIKKLGRAKTPPELEKKFRVLDAIGVKQNSNR